MLEMGAYRPSKNDGLEISTLSSQIGNRVSVTDSCNFLIEDRSFIEFFGDVVGCCANDFHASVMRLSIGIRTDEGRQEGVVDVDDARSVGIDEERRQDLHVPGKDDEVDLFVLEFGEDPMFLLALRFRCHRKVAIGDTHVLDEIGMIRVIVDDGHDVGWKFP